MNIWVRTKPTEAGWYWFCDGSHKGIVRVARFRAFGHRYCAKTSQGWQPVDELDAEWSGPIPEPAKCMNIDGQCAASWCDCEYQLKKQKMKRDIEHTTESLKRLIGQPPEGSHPDEWGPRADSWHAERLNWQNEVQRLREANIALSIKLDAIENAALRTLIKP